MPTAPRILVVEDEPAIADAVLYALRTEGMTAVWHTTGRAARAELERGDIDLIVLDVGLPDTNGFDWCREVRRHSRVPVIFLTARGDVVDRVVGLELGADDYVAKPFSPRELSVRVRTVLRRSRPEADDPMAGAFVVDDARLSIRFHGVPLTLTRAQFRILRALVAQPGQVFARSRLIDVVGDPDEPCLERTIDSHIKDLRAKLRAVRAQGAAIVTHRGEGYALAESG